LSNQPRWSQMVDKILQGPLQYPLLTTAQRPSS
jgi:hypothetical protein